MAYSQTICFGNTQNATIYDKNSSLQFSWAKSTIDAYTNLFCESRMILDIGCGNGTTTMELIAPAAPQSKIIGLDINEAMVALAEYKYSDKSKVQFVVGNIENITYREIFDIIFSCCCLQWLPDQNQAITKISQSLVEHGYAFIIIPGKTDSLFPLGRELSTTPEWKPYFQNIQCHRSYYTEDEYINLLKNNGLAPIRITNTITETPFDNVEKLREWIKPISPYYEYLVEDTLKKNFLDQLVDEILLYTKQDTGNIVLMATKMEVVAMKKI